MPEFHCGGGDQIFYTAANSEQGEVYLDINGETFPSLEACKKRYDILIYCGEENVTGRMLKQVDGQGRPQVLLMDQGIFTIIVSGRERGKFLQSVFGMPCCGISACGSDLHPSTIPGQPEYLYL